MTPVFDGRFRVLSKLGEGGMAAVYLVDNLRTRRKEALKILHPDVSDAPNVIGRFRREARATCRLAHPNIIALYEFGRLSNGSLFITTEYVEGISLEARLRKGPLPPAVALPLLVQLATALDHAHARGVIHRDLKPSNLLIVDEGAEDLLKVIDFGIAKITSVDYSDSIAATGSRELYGTPAYMAPEQIGGSYDPRMDLYALGCIAFEMLVGTPPFTGPLPKVLHDHLEAAPPHPAQHRPGIPNTLDAIVVRCLAKDPDDRFRSGGDLAAALERVPGYRRTQLLEAMVATEIEGTRDAQDPVDAGAGSDALLYAAAEAMFARTHDRDLEAALCGMSTMEIALDAIDAELATLEAASDESEDEDEQAEITDRAITLAARKADQEAEIADQFDSLRTIVDRVAPHCRDDTLVRDLLARARALQMLRGR